jgi:HEAT repeat protein
VSDTKRRPRRRSRVERLRDRGDVGRLVRLLAKRDWLADRDGVLIDLAVGHRIEVVKALGAIGGPAAEDGVVGALEDEDPRVRDAAVKALAPSPGTRAGTALAEAAARWRDPRLAEPREAAVQLLAELRDSRYAVAFGRALLERTFDGGLSEAECDAMRRLFATDVDPDFVRELVARLGSGPGREGRTASRMLVAIGHPAVPPLVAALVDDERWSDAAASLAEIRDARAVPALVEMLSSPDPVARAAAARALGEIGDTRAVEGLVHCTADSDIDVRRAALDALDGMRTVAAILAAATLMVERGGEGRSRHPQLRDTGSASPAALIEHERSLLKRLLGLR